MRVQLYNAVLFLSMDYKKDIFAVFTYEFELSRVIGGRPIGYSIPCFVKQSYRFFSIFTFLFYLETTS